MILHQTKNAPPRVAQGGADSVSGNSAKWSFRNAQINNPKA